MGTQSLAYLPHSPKLLALMTRRSDISIENAQGIALRALTFVAGDPAILSRFLETTGWTPQSLNAPETRSSIPLAALDFLMSAEDMLLIFAANAGLDPVDVARAHQTLQNAGQIAGRDED